ncbi:MAG: SAM-dependent methyltransferase, partial [Burkholderiaceae bacterium]
MTIEIFLVGVGTGNPAHITLQAIEQLKSADIIIIPRKGDNKSDLADLRYQICNEILGEECPQLFEFDLPTRNNKQSYSKAVEEWHETIAKIWIDCIEKAQKDLKKSVKSVGLLIWGDPSLYDSSLRIAKRLKPTPQITIIPGITSVQALSAAHKITINQIG